MPAPALAPASLFMRLNLPRLLARYRIRCAAEGDCMAYFIVSRASGREISRDLMISLNRFSRRIEIIRFYPQFYTRPDTKFFSAASLYLMIHHFAQFFRIAEAHQVFVRTRPEIYARFYRSLLDFNFHPVFEMAGTIDLAADYVRSDIDTSMVASVPSADQHAAFMVA
ncbi:hypothetical protein HNR65_003004 [Desulfosalsimonas propionicica]|uniref:Uncharacterized protein n=1 Tax=Desulfosalsimonas propionicica TaxID=332175 RepID=A0A7W0HLT4_9BACT|nr:hypothetical protein [Desulfosalsimonas propionicica]MBA2882650.1 hypothetical protein [Desulfosalsimonas propionicica]